LLLSCLASSAYQKSEIPLIPAPAFAGVNSSGNPGGTGSPLSRGRADLYQRVLPRAGARHWFL